MPLRSNLWDMYSTPSLPVTRQVHDRSDTMLTTLETDAATKVDPPALATMTRRPATASRWKSWGFPKFSAAHALGTAFLVLVLTIVLGNLGAPSPLITFTAAAAAVFLGLSTLMGLYRATHETVNLLRPSPDRTSATVGGSILAILRNLLVAGFGILVAYLATFGFSRGRQLRRFGRVLLPRLRPESGWTGCSIALDGDVAPDGVADQWRENGRTEHASVAAFARLTLDLMALGAPPELIAAANRDALDEIRHTELCFSLACALDGKRVSPGPFPEAQRVPTLPRLRTFALAKLAVGSLIDGALHEGVSARVIGKLARRSTDPAINAVLKELAADEGRHAAHGWAVVEWCLDEGGQPVRTALLAALRALPSAMHSTLPEAASDGGWERWGIHGHGLESQEYSAALARVIERVHRLVVARSTAA
jgi:hypothetical protein